MNARRLAATAAGIAGIAALSAALSCKKGEPPTSPPLPAAAPATPRPPVQETFSGGPYPTLLMTSAQFDHGADGKPKPGYALLSFWRKEPSGWKSYKLEDPDSNVFHKAIAYDGGVLTIGAEQAFLKKWTQKDGKWSAQTLWNPSWGGKYNRLRDLEIGDVNGDGKDDLVMASHDSGVIGVGSFDAAGKFSVTELHKKPDTFVHEIEIGDIDGDGKNEFFATPSDRNQSSGASQPGGVLMYRWDGTTYQETQVDSFEQSHAKEILAVTLDKNKKADFFAVVEAQTSIENGQAKIVKPVEIRHYSFAKDGTITHDVIATIDDKQCRFLVPGDLDGDGKTELYAAALKSGIWQLKRDAKGVWQATNIERSSSGFEHTAWISDIDHDGRQELFVAADDQGELRQYDYNPQTRLFDKQVIGPILKDSITWNLTSTDL